MARSIRMPAISPTAEGFRVAFRRPLLTLGEITWRWVVSATVAALFLFGLFEYLRTLPVSRAEMFFLRSRQPYLVAQAIAHILRGSLSRAVLSLLLAALGLVLLWMLAGAFGRFVTVQWLLDYFRGRTRSPSGDSQRGERGVASNVSPGALVTLFRLNFLRVSVWLAAALALVGASIVAGFASSQAHPRPALAFLLFMPIAGLICLTWFALNWFLSLAGMFAVRDSADVIGSISAAGTFCRQRTGAVVAVSIWTGLAHLVVLVGATTVVSMPLAFAPLVPWRLALLAMIVLTLAYFVVADWLYMARLAGYVCIAEAPEEWLKAPLPPPPPIIVPPAPLQTSIDHDELILSDVPTPSGE